MDTLSKELRRPVVSWAIALAAVLASAAPALAAGGDDGHDESLWPMVGKIVNFAILIGTVVYFGRRPIAAYLTGRREQVRADLVAADALRRSAAAQIVDIDAKLQALPAELDALRARGRDETANEQQRIRRLAETESARLVEQAAREIDQRTRIARRELVEHAATLTIGVAERKIAHEITDADRERLVDRYVAGVASHE